MPSSDTQSPWRQWREDIRHHSRGSMWRVGYNFLFNPSYQLAASVRWIAMMERGFRPLVPLLKIRQHRAFGCQISNRATIGNRIRFPHPLGIVIGVGAVVGDDVTIYQQVTIGAIREDGERRYPVIEDGCTLYPGCRIIGGITIGANSVVGANAVVTKSCPPNSTLLGIPARAPGVTSPPETREPASPAPPSW